MRTDTRCFYCNGTGQTLDIDEDDGEVFLTECWSCKGTGRKWDTLTPFLNELDDVAEVVGVQARFMEDVANISLQEMCDRFDREWAARERREHAERIRLRLQLRLDGVLARLRKPERIVSHNLNGMAIDTEGWVPAEHVEHDRLRDLYRAREPWYFEYTPYSKQSWGQRLSTWWYVFRYKRGWLR